MGSRDESDAFAPRVTFVRAPRRWQQNAGRGSTGAASGEGEAIGAGDRFGMIRFGSRLDVYLPEGTRALVAEGQTAIAGETVIADLRGAEGPRSFKVS